MSLIVIDSIWHHALIPLFSRFVQLPCWIIFFK